MNINKDKINMKVLHIFCLSIQKQTRSIITIMHRLTLQSVRWNFWQHLFSIYAMHIYFHICFLIVVSNVYIINEGHWANEIVIYKHIYWLRIAASVLGLFLKQFVFISVWCFRNLCSFIRTSTQPILSDRTNTIHAV